MWHRLKRSALDIGAHQNEESVCSQQVKKEDEVLAQAIGDKYIGKREQGPHEGRKEGKRKKNLDNPSQIEELSAFKLCKGGT